MIFLRFSFALILLFSILSISSSSTTPSLTSSPISSTISSPLEDATYILAQPITLSLKKKKSSPSSSSDLPSVPSSTSKINTKVKFFEDYLKLKENKLVNLNDVNYKLSLLNKSPLFSNLSYNSLVNSTTNSIQINITGEEKPSVIFSPSISFNPNRKHPEISGGLLYKDKNFRGMGESLDILVASKEGLELNLADISSSPSLSSSLNYLDQPSSKSSSYFAPNSLLRLIWQDSPYGKKSRVQFHLESEGIVERLGSLTSNFPSVPVEETSWKHCRVPAIVTQLGLNSMRTNIFFNNSLLSKFTSEVYLRSINTISADKLKHFSIKSPTSSSSSYSSSPSSSPSASTSSSSSSSSSSTNLFYSGIKNLLKLQSQYGIASIYHDSGFQFSNNNENKLNPFSSYGSEIYLRPSTLYYPSTSFIEKLSLKNIFKFKRSFGSGLYPLEHTENLLNSRTIRGCSEEASSPIVSSYSIKSDFELKLKNGIKFGCFNDNLWYSTQCEPSRTHLSTLGVFSKLKGFRIDVGTTLTNLIEKKNLPRIHFGLDVQDI